MVLLEEIPKQFHLLKHQKVLNLVKSKTASAPRGCVLKITLNRASEYTEGPSLQCWGEEARVQRDFNDVTTDAK